jgi:hypothetical protein
MQCGGWLGSSRRKEILSWLRRRRWVMLPEACCVEIEPGLDLCPNIGEYIGHSWKVVNGTIEEFRKVVMQIIDEPYAIVMRVAWIVHSGCVSY